MEGENNKPAFDFIEETQAAKNGWKKGRSRREGNTIVLNGKYKGNAMQRKKP